MDCVFTEEKKRPVICLIPGQRGVRTAAVSRFLSAASAVCRDAPQTQRMETGGTVSSSAVTGAIHNVFQSELLRERSSPERSN